MRSELYACLLLVLAGCYDGAAVLSRNVPGDDGGTTDTGVDGALADASIDAADTSMPDTSMPDTSTPDASVTANVTIHGTGFGASAGLSIYGQLGFFSGNKVSATIASDGTFTLEFDPVTFAPLNTIRLDTYVDENGNGSCQRPPDTVAGTFITFMSDGDGTYSATVDRSALSPPLIPGCSGL